MNRKKSRGKTAFRKKVLNFEAVSVVVVVVILNCQPDSRFLLDDSLTGKTGRGCAKV